MSTFENFVQCRVASPITAAATSLELYAAVAPYNLPSDGGGVLVLTDSPGNPSKIEIIRYASRSALGLYGVERGQEGTNAIEWTGPVYCYQALMAGEMQSILSSIANLNTSIGGDADFSGTMSTELAKKVDKVAGKALSANDFTNALLSKLNDIAAAATKNATDAQLRARASHTGEQEISTVTGLPAALASKVDKTAGQSLMLDAERSKLANLSKTDVGLGNVDNTADASKPVSSPQLSALNLKAPINSPALTGKPTAPTAAQTEDSGQIASTAFVKAALVPLANMIAEIGSGTSFFIKTDSRKPAWLVDAGLKTSQKIRVPFGSSALEYASGFVVTLPTLTAGNDYAIYATEDGRLLADLNWSAPSGEPAGTARKLGGFHVALTGEIMPYSLWDLNYRPSCPDPRGMVCINGMFWSDIYLLGVNHHVDGTSRASVTIADGASPPKVPTIYGGNGSAAYANLTWFVAQDVLQSHGKRCPSWAEFSMLAFGVTEGTSVGPDPVTTKYDGPRRSRWGVEQATGNMWVWGADVQGNAGGEWAAITDGRGSVYNSGVTAVLLGADWANAGISGSRSADWSASPSSSSGVVSARGLSDHLCLLAER